MKKDIKMGRILFFIGAYLTLMGIFHSARGQSDHFTYAVTSVNKGGTAWVALRKLDTRTGEFGNILMNLRDNPSPDSSVAAIAFDSKTNRLYYTAMNNDQLRYIDLSTMQSVAVADQFFSKSGKYDPRNAGPINRMVIAPDGNGYTITNDGTHLIKFSTSGSPVISDLGDLVDDPMNKEMTIHSPCTNSGGDLVADDAGHLFLVTGYNKVYKVDIATRSTTFLATISSLPQKFTTSGLAVGEDGRQLIITSSVYSDAYFLVDPDTWTASAPQSPPEKYETADLANNNILFTKSASASDLFISKNRGNLVRIYPNPVLEDDVSIQFNGLPPGNYTIQLSNIMGIKVGQQKAVITGLTQTETMHIPRYAAQGFYYVRIVNERNQVVATQTLVVER